MNCIHSLSYLSESPALSTKWLASALLLLMLTRVAGAQQSPKLTGASVTVSVSTASALFNYSYVLNNPKTSNGSIWGFDIDLSKPAGSVDLSTNGLTNDSVADILAKAVQADPKAVPTVPVAFTSPAGWTGGPSVSGTGGWAADDEATFVAPGSSASGFVLASPGLPGIRTATLKPYIDVDTLSVPPPDGPGDLQRYINAVNAIKATSSVQTVTIGPTSPPASFVPLDFLKTIISYKEQALQQGWIDNDGTATSLDSKLNAVQAALQRGDNGAAKNQVNALLNEIDAQSGKHVTSEAAALLTFNTHYLLSKIP